MEPVVLVTGGAQRIGAMLCRHLHRLGYKVIVHYRQSHSCAKALVDQLNRERPSSTTCLAANCCDVGDMEQLARDAVSTWGRLDVLINNASSFYPTPLTEATPTQWDDLMGSNVKGAYFLSQALRQALLETSGTIINITDIHSQMPMRQYSIYTMAKAALRMMTKALAKELAPDIRVNAVAPGAIIWPEDENALSAESKAKIIEKTALKCGGQPQDVANAVEFLITQAPYMTGQMLRVDGGRHLGA